MSRHQAEVGCADGAGGEDKLALAQAEHLGADQPRVGGPEEDDQDHDHVAQRGAEHRGDQQREEQGGEGELDFDEAHCEGVEQSAPPAGEQPDRGAQHQRTGDGGGDHDQRCLAALDQAAERIAAESISAEYVLPAAFGLPDRIGEPVDQRLVGRIVRRDPVGEDAGEDEDADDREVEQQQGPAARQALAQRTAAAHGRRHAARRLGGVQAHALVPTRMRGSRKL